MKRLPSLITFIALLGAHQASASAAQSDVAEIIAFADIKLGDVVAEFLPDDHFTQALCNAVGVAGRVYTVSVTQPTTPESTHAPCTNVITIELKMQRHPAPESWSASDDPGVVYEYWSFTQPAENFATPEPLDVIVTQHYHDLYDMALGPANTQLVGAAWLAALKPAGVLVIAESLTRVKPEQIKQEMRAAGFIWMKQIQTQAKTAPFMLRFRKP